MTACETRSQRLVFLEEEPKQVGGARLTADERRSRLANQLCPNCGEAGHMAAACRVVGGAAGGSFIRQGGEVSVSRTIGSVPGFKSLAQRCPNGSRQGKSCCGLAHPR